MVRRTEAFACAADEVWRLQRGSDADCVLFQKWSNGGERITDRGTRQGFWVFAPNGALLGRINSRSPEKVLSMFDRALAAWDALGPDERRSSEGTIASPAHRWEDGYPEDGFVLERISRDIPSDALAASPSPRWNRDTVWFSAAEVRGMMPADPTPGDRFEVPLMASRLARFALVDDARGQTLPYAGSEVEQAEIFATVRLRAGALVHVTLEGSTAAVADEAWLLGDNHWKPKRRFPHGMACSLRGSATLDLEAGKFVKFDLIALGRRHGRTAFNGRGKDLGPSLVGFHFAPTVDRLAPTFASLYDVPWIPRPEVPTWRDAPPPGLGDGR